MPRPSFFFNGYNSAYPQPPFRDAWFFTPRATKRMARKSQYIYHRVLQFQRHHFSLRIPSTKATPSSLSSWQASVLICFLCFPSFFIFFCIGQLLAFCNFWPKAKHNFYRHRERFEIFLCFRFFSGFLFIKKFHWWKL